jgi:AAA15 family ATPase/GTPase
MIKNIQIKNFIGHDLIDTDKFTPITLIIGDNDTGKTGILKILYATAKSLEIFSRRVNSIAFESSFKKILSQKMFNTFQPRQGRIGELVSKGAREKLSVEINFQKQKQDKSVYSQNIYFNFGEKTHNSIVECSDKIDEIPESFFNALFIPAKEILTFRDAIKFSRLNDLFGFDDTYLDLIEALEVQSRQGSYPSDLVKVNRKLEDLFDGSIVTSDKDGSLIFKKGNSEFSMSLTSEGIKKIGILTTLIRNRQLNKNTVLFIDEIEMALHPKAIRKVIEMIVDMSRAGVQIILSTHSYFVIKQLVIAAKRDEQSILCLSLTKKDKQMNIDSFDLKEGMPSNSIVDEALKMFNEEVELDFR